ISWPLRAIRRWRAPLTAAPRAEIVFIEHHDGVQRTLCQAGAGNSPKMETARAGRADPAAVGRMPRESISGGSADRAHPARARRILERSGLGVSRELRRPSSEITSPVAI